MFEEIGERGPGNEASLVSKASYKKLFLVFHNYTSIRVLPISITVPSFTCWYVPVSEIGFSTHDDHIMHVYT